MVATREYAFYRIKLLVTCTRKQLKNTRILRRKRHHSGSPKISSSTDFHLRVRYWKGNSIFAWQNTRVWRGPIQKTFALAIVIRLYYRWCTDVMDFLTYRVYSLCFTRLVSIAVTGTPFPYSIQLFSQPPTTCSANPLLFVSLFTLLPVLFRSSTKYRR